MIRFSKAAWTAAAILAAGQAMSEEIKLDDGTSCTVVQGEASASGGTSTTVTAGNGHVSSSTTTGGATTSSGSSSTSSAAASAGSGSVDSFSTASITRPDGTVITKRSDGTCSVMKPNK